MGNTKIVQFPRRTNTQNTIPEIKSLPEQLNLREILAYLHDPEFAKMFKRLLDNFKEIRPIPKANNEHNEYANIIYLNDSLSITGDKRLDNFICVLMENPKFRAETLDDFECFGKQFMSKN
jgi:hypothetical protein